MKTCNKCKLEKPLSDFYVKTRYPDGFDYSCKVCLAPSEKARREKRRLALKALSENQGTKIKKSNQSQKTVNLKQRLKEVIRSSKINFHLGLITQEECTNKISAVTKRLRNSILLDNREVRKKLKKEQEKQRVKEEKSAIKKANRVALLENQKSETRTRQKAKQSAYEKKRRKENPLFRLACNLRHRTKEALKRGNFSKKSSLSQYLGCSMNEFKSYLESLFQPGMDWNNQGSKMGQWSMDHNYPLASTKSEEELYVLCHYTNIRPMWAYYNSIKSDMSPTEWASYKLAHQIDESLPPWSVSPPNKA